MILEASTSAIDVIGEDRAVAVVRVNSLRDPIELANALADGGIRAVEFTFTTVGVESCISQARDSRALVGAGTVLTADQARAAIDAGAQFLVTPGIAESVAAVASDARVPVAMGVMSPSEVMRALDLGAAAVKVFPAITVGASHFAQLLGPFPGLRLIASGGIDHTTARSYIEAGAIAVTAGSSVVSPQLVAACNWDELRVRASIFSAAATG